MNRPYVASRPGMPRRPIVQAWYGPDGRIFYPETHGNLPARGDNAAEQNETDFVSVNRDGSDRRKYVTFPFADEAAVSPTGEWKIGRAHV